MHKSHLNAISDGRRAGQFKIRYAVIIFIVSSLLAAGGVNFLKDYQYKREITELKHAIFELDKTVEELKADNILKEKELNLQKDNYDAQIEKLQKDIRPSANNKADFYSNNAIASRANEAVLALKNKDMKKLSSIVHPKKGVRFSPYAYVDVKSHRILTSVQIEKALNDNSKYNWGSFDGSGDPISMTFKEYHERFIYNKDYASSDKIGYNKTLSEGNSLNNAEEIYPGAKIVEYYLPGTNPKYGGMDWGSLKLVFEESDGTLYLVGVIHNEWTI